MQRAMRARLNLILFPEGGRTAKGDEFVYSASGSHRVRRFKEGIGQLVARTGCATLPVWVEGSDKALPIGSAIPRVQHRVTLRVGTVQQYERRRFASRYELRAAARETTQQLCDALLALADER
jgi:1-acyl-sn-glycerol-3-phosphate acyltransferase